MNEPDYTYRASDDDLARWIEMFTSRQGDGQGDPEETYLAAIRLAASCKAGGDFLDIGCGFGRILDLLKPYAGTVLGIEPDRERFAAFRAGARGEAHVTVLNGFSRDLKAAHPDRRFDLITVSMVVQHVATATCAGLLADVRDLLRPDGVAIIASTHFFEERFIYESDVAPKTRAAFDCYAERTDRQDLGIPVRLFSKDSFVGAIERAGLQVEVWQQFFYARPERLDAVAADFGVAVEAVRDRGFSQYCAVRVRGARRGSLFRASR